MYWCSETQVPFCKGPLSVVKWKVTPFDRVYALSDHMTAKTAQQFPPEKVLFINTTRQ